MHTLPVARCLAAALVATLASTDDGLCQSSLIIPEVLGDGLTEGGSYSSCPWSQSNLSSRHQFLYDTTHFTNRGVNATIYITQLRWRADGGRVSAGGSIHNARITLGNAAMDFSNASNVFALNYLGGVQPPAAYDGPITVGATSSSAPNAFYIDVTLQVPFEYDPSLGHDLVCEIQIDIGQHAPRPPDCDFASSSQTPNVTRVVGRGGWMSTTASNVYQQSGPCCDVIYQTAPPGAYATATSVGSGCGAGVHAIYEVFDGTGSAFDFAPGTGFALQFSGGEYTAVPGTRPITPPSSIAIPFADDQVRPVNVPFPLPLRDGSTTSMLWVSSNGWISFAPTTDAEWRETVSGLLTSVARIAPLWDDLNPSSRGRIHAELNANGDFDVTFSDVPEWGSSSGNTFQVTFAPNGSIEVKYGAIALLDALVGWSAGGGVGDPGPIDLNDPSLAVTSAAGPDENLGLTSARPVIGTSVTFETVFVPPGALAGAVLLSFSTFVNPLDLGLIGAPGCVLIGPSNGPAISFAPSGPMATHSLTLMADPRLSGRKLALQSAVIAPGRNPLGVLTSNGIEWCLGVR